MQAFRNIVGGPQQGQQAAGTTAAPAGAPVGGTATTGGGFNYKSEINLQNMRLTSLPPGITAFEPYLAIARNDERYSLRTASKPFNISSMEPLVFNENYNLDLNQPDILKLWLYNAKGVDAPIGLASINIRDFIGTNVAGADGLINSRVFEVPLFQLATPVGGTATGAGMGGTAAAPGAAPASGGHHGLLGKLQSLLPHHDKSGGAAGTTGTAAAPGGAAPTLGAQIGVILLGLQLWDYATLGKTTTGTVATVPGGIGATGMQQGAVGAPVGGVGAAPGVGYGAPVGVQQPGVDSGLGGVPPTQAGGGKFISSTGVVQSTSDTSQGMGAAQPFTGSGVVTGTGQGRTY